VPCSEHDGTTFNPLHRQLMPQTDRQTDDIIMPIINHTVISMIG